MSRILYHGSSIFTDILIPNIAYGWGYQEGCMNAVYQQVTVFPLEIIKINVNDYLHLMRYATEEEKKIFSINKNQNM